MKFYLIGIKGSGMSALALLLNDDGYIVEGSDVNKYIFTEERLKSKNIKIHSLSNLNYLKNYFVIIGHDFYEKYLIDFLTKKKIPFMEYHKFLSFYIKRNSLVSVCGSHGKTTMVGLLSQGSDDSSFLRGDGYGKKSNNEDFFFLESCEYKDHFLEYCPQDIIITNIDYDHVDYFKNEKMYIDSFNKFAKKGKNVLIDYDDRDKLNIKDYLTFGINPNADFNIKNFDISINGIKGDFYFRSGFVISFQFNQLYGVPLLKDICCVLGFYYLKNYDLNKVINNLKKFKMADKRFNVCNYDNYVIIEDYAHHPSQMSVNFSNVKLLFNNFKHIAIYKPDRESRLKYFKKGVEFHAFLF